MKKTYYSPQIIICNLGTQAMMAASDTFNQNKSEQEINMGSEEYHDTFGSRRRRDEWEEEEEEDF